MKKPQAAVLCLLLSIAALAPLTQACHHESKPSAKGYALAPATSDAAVTPKLLHDDANVKIVLVRIAAGQTMSEHITPVPVTVQTLSGAGSMMVSGAANKLTVGSIYHMDAKAPHSLSAETGEPLVVLVHYLKAPAKNPHPCGGNCAHQEQKETEHDCQHEGACDGHEDGHGEGRHGGDHKDHGEGLHNDEN